MVAAGRREPDEEEEETELETAEETV